MNVEIIEIKIELLSLIKDLFQSCKNNNIKIILFCVKI